MTDINDIANAMEKGEAGLTDTPRPLPSAPSPSSTSNTLWSTQSDPKVPKPSSRKP
jgi:hypothetical protein